MPELPEVETHVRDLQPLVGSRITAVTTTVPKAWTPSFRRAQAVITGTTIRAISRRGKYICLNLGVHTLVVHFRMTGHFLRRIPDDPLERCVRHRFTLKEGRRSIELRFEDIRKFGTFGLVPTDALSTYFASRLGLEPLASDFTFAALRAQLGRRRGSLKSVLLNQAVIAGIGNIYADEICFTARLHPACRVETLTVGEFRRLHAAIVAELTKGVTNRGTTFSEFKHLDGQPGTNQYSLRAYGRGGEPCVVCGGLLDVTQIAQRTTVYCPTCQPHR